MSILNVDKIQPIGSGSTVTVNATDTILTNAQAGVITATSFSGSGSTIDNIQIGVTGGNEIDTSSGNLTIDSAGGTTNITDILNVTGSHVNLETGSASTQMQLRFGTNAEKSRITVVAATNDGYTGSTVGETVFNTNSQLSFSALGSQALTITSGRNIGIGRTDPGHKLAIHGGSSSQLEIKGTEADIWLNSTPKGVKQMSDNGSLVFQTPGSGYSTKLNIASDGKISVGTVQTTHTLGITGGSSSQLLVKGTEADIWMESTGPSGVWRILGSTGTNTHRFRIYDNTNGKEPFYIDGSSGTNTQHVHVNSGNLVFDAAGTGIDFSAQTSSSASGVTTNNETLDHFEEGTWTPTQATIGSWASGAEIDGKYQRVGNWVTASFIVKYASNGSGHAASIDGLPFTNNNTGSSYKQGGFISYANNSNVSSLLIGNGENRIYIYTNSGSTYALTNMDNVEVRGTVIYRVA